MGPGDTEIDEEFRHRFRYHRATTVGVDGVRLATDTVHGVVEEVVRHDGVLGGGNEPSGDIAGIDVEDDVAVTGQVPDARSTHASCLMWIRARQRPGPDLDVANW